MTASGSMSGAEPRLSSVLEGHVAAQPNSATASTYSARLRPVAVRLGHLRVEEIDSRTLEDFEAELAAEVGGAAARKAVVLTRAALHRAGHNLGPHDALTLVAAGKRFRVAVHSLRALADAGRVRHVERCVHGRGVSIVFSASQLEEDLQRLPRCLAPGCEEPGTGPSGYCGEHFGHGGRERARKAERDRLGGPERDWYWPAEAAKHARVSVATIHNKLKRGELPSTKEGRYRRIPREAVERLRETTASRRRPKKPTLDETEDRRQEIQRLCDKDPSIVGHPGRLADRFGVSKPTIYNDLDVLGLERPGKGRQSRKLPPEQSAARKQRARELYVEAGYSVDEIAEQLDSSPTQIRRDLEGVKMRAAGRRPSGPPAVERPCRKCGRSFTPRYPSHDSRVFCPECVVDWREFRADEPKDVARARGLTVDELAGRWAKTEHQIGRYIADGLLTAERVTVPGALRSVWVVKPKAADHFERKWALGEDGRRVSRWRDVDAELERKKHNGELAKFAAAEELTFEEAEWQLRGRLERARKRFARRRSGRKPSNGPPEHSRRWQDMYDQLERELVDAWQRDQDEGLAAGKRPSRLDVCAAVAENDLPEHPETWPPYWQSAEDPDALHPRLRSDAATRVWNGLKSAAKRADSKDRTVIS